MFRKWFNKYFVKTVEKEVIREVTKEVIKYEPMTIIQPSSVIKWDPADRDTLEAFLTTETGLKWIGIHENQIKANNYWAVNNQKNDVDACGIAKGYMQSYEHTLLMSQIKRVSEKPDETVHQTLLERLKP